MIRSAQSFGITPARGSNLLQCYAVQFQRRKHGQNPRRRGRSPRQLVRNRRFGFLFEAMFLEPLRQLGVSNLRAHLWSSILRRSLDNRPYFSYIEGTSPTEGRIPDAI